MSPDAASLHAALYEAAKADKDGRRLAARLFAELGLADGALMIPRFEAELAVALAVGAGVDIGVSEMAGERFCPVCGCTAMRACRGPGGPCAWAEGDPSLCTVCAAYPEPL